MDDGQQWPRHRLPPRRRRHAAGARAELGNEATFTERSNGDVEVELTITSRGAFVNFALGFLDHAEVLSPPEVRDEMIAWLERAAR